MRTLENNPRFPLPKSDTDRDSPNDAHTPDSDHASKHAIRLAAKGVILTSAESALPMTEPSSQNAGPANEVLFRGAWETSADDGDWAGPNKPREFMNKSDF